MISDGGYKGYFNKLNKQLSKGTKKRLSNIKSQRKNRAQGKREKPHSNDENVNNVLKKSIAVSKRRIMKPFRRIVNSNVCTRNNSQTSSQVREIRSSSKTELIHNFQGSLRGSKNNNRERLRVISNKKEDSLSTLALYTTKNRAARNSAKNRGDLLSFESKKYQYKSAARIKDQIFTGSLDEIRYNEFNANKTDGSIGTREVLSQSNLDFSSLKRNFKGFRNKKYSGYVSKPTPMTPLGGREEERVPS